MMEPIIPKKKPALHDENKHGKDSSKSISDILKYTNQLIQQGKFDRAQGELLQAIHSAKESFNKETQAHNDAEQSPAGNTEQAGKNTFVRHAEFKPVQLDNPRIEYAYYREALISVWYNGPLTIDEERQIQELRTVLEISDIEHEMIEKEAKVFCYRNAVDHFLSTGTAMVLGAKSLIDIQAAFQISEEESEKILSSGSGERIEKDLHSEKIQASQIPGKETGAEQNHVPLKEAESNYRVSDAEIVLTPSPQINTWWSRDLSSLNSALIDTEPRSLPLRLMDAGSLQRLALPDSRSEFLVLRAPADFLIPMLTLCTKGFSLDRIKGECIPVLRLGRSYKTNLYLACLETAVPCDALKIYPCAVYSAEDRTEEVLEALEALGHPVVILFTRGLKETTAEPKKQEFRNTYIYKVIAAPLLRWDSLAATFARTINLISQLSAGDKK
jgi:hypothetical protein